MMSIRKCLYLGFSESTNSSGSSVLYFVGFSSEHVFPFGLKLRFGKSCFEYHIFVITLEARDRRSSLFAICVYSEMSLSFSVSHSSELVLYSHIF